MEEQAIILTSPDASQMTNEDLAAFIRDGLKKFAQLIPYVRELKTRFAALPRGKADIMGCHTWKEFCEKVLGRTDSAVRKALAQESGTTTKKPQLLLEAVKTLLDIGEDVRFTANEDGVLLSVRNKSQQEEEYELEYQLDVKPLLIPPHITLSGENQAGEVIKSEGTWSENLPPFDFEMQIKFVMDYFKAIKDGDPTIIFTGPGELVRFSEGDGELRFIYAPSPRVVLLSLGMSPGQIRSALGLSPEKQPPALTEEDRQRAAETKARMEAQEVERKKKAAEEEALLQSAGSLALRLPHELRCIVVRAFVETKRVGINLAVTLEQLENVVKALAPMQADDPNEDEMPECPDDLAPQEDQIPRASGDSH